MIFLSILFHFHPIFIFLRALFKKSAQKQVAPGLKNLTDAAHPNFLVPPLPCSGPFGPRWPSATAQNVPFCAGDCLVGRFPPSKSGASHHGGGFAPAGYCVVVARAPSGHERPFGSRAQSGALREELSVVVWRRFAPLVYGRGPKLVSSEKARFCTASEHFARKLRTDLASKERTKAPFRAKITTSKNLGPANWSFWRK